MFAHHKPDDVHSFDLNPAWWDTRPPVNPRRRTGVDGKVYNPGGDFWARRRFGVDSEEFSDDRAMDAQMRAIVRGHTSKADPGTSETVNPRSAAMFWTGFGSCAAITAGVWALSVLTGALL